MRSLFPTCLALLTVTGCSMDATPRNGWRLDAESDRDSRATDVGFEDVPDLGPGEDGWSSPPVRNPLAVGSFHNCIILNDYSVDCFGKPNYGTLEVPDAKFNGISLGYEHSCGVTLGGEIECWGRDHYGQASPPKGKTFEDVALGRYHTCGLTSDGKVSCWGLGTSAAKETEGFDYNQAIAPDGRFEDIAAGLYHTCADKMSGDGLTCWGRTRFGSDDIPDADFEEISSGHGFTCGLRSEGTVYCWGKGPVWGTSEWAELPSPTGVYRDLDASSTSACAIRQDGRLQCWQIDEGKLSEEVPEGTFEAVAVGSVHACALEKGGDLQCWGQNYLGSTEVPARYR